MIQCSAETMPDWINTSKRLLSLNGDFSKHTRVEAHSNSVCLGLCRISNATRDPILWMHRVCKILKKELNLQLQLPNRPAEMISDFPLVRFPSFKLRNLGLVP